MITIAFAKLCGCLQIWTRTWYNAFIYSFIYVFSVFIVILFSFKILIEKKKKKKIAKKMLNCKIQMQIHYD